MEQKYIRAAITLAMINNYYNKNYHGAAYNQEKKVHDKVVYWNFFNFVKVKMVSTVTCKPKNSFKTI